MTTFDWLTLAIGLLSLVAQEWVPKLHPFARNLITAIGLLALGYAAISGLQEMTGTKLQWGPLFLILAGLAFMAGGVFWHIQQRPTESIPERLPATTGTVPERGPTLEADSNAGINAAGAVIPGDLPFQFGKASTGGFINMPGIQVTRKDDGIITVTPGKSEITLPPPPDELVWLGNEELKSRLRATANDLRSLQQEYSAQTAEDIKSLPNQEPLKNTIEKYIGIYKDKYADAVQGLAAAALNRIGTIQQPDISRAAKSGGSLVYSKQFAGPMPGNDIAEFLELLVSKLR